MRLLSAVSSAILIAALAAPAALAQDSGRGYYGPVTPGKPDPKAKHAKAKDAKPAPAKTAATPKPAKEASAPAKPTPDVTTDGKSARGKQAAKTARTAKPNPKSKVAAAKETTGSLTAAAAERTVPPALRD